MYRYDLIKSEMAVQDLTDEQVAEKSGLTRQTVALLRKGETENPELKTLNAIALALGLHLSDLFTGQPRRQLRRVA